MKTKGKGSVKQNEKSKEESSSSAGTGGERKARKVTFKVNATTGSTVALAGSFNNWDPEAIKLKHAGKGIYSTSVSLPPGRHEYKFLVDGEWLIDMQCPNGVRNSFGTHNSVVEVP